MYCIISYELINPIVNKPIILKIIISANISMQIKIKAMIDNIVDNEKCTSTRGIRILIVKIKNQNNKAASNTKRSGTA